MANYHHRHRNQHDTLPGRRLPDRWNLYDNVGRDIEGTRFVPFKTPLDPSFFVGKNMPNELQFDVRSLINMAKGAQKEIGLVIDLTNTDKYYRKREWDDYGVRFIKLNCPGHEINEREDLVEKFLNIVKEYVEDEANDGKLIGVHCTHGVNRTGYLICRYMIDIDNYSAADAISMFEYYRGHVMERPKYKESLYEAELRRKEAEKLGEPNEPTPENESLSKNEPTPENESSPKIESPKKDEEDVEESKASGDSSI